jgi:hypothetical protein
VERQEKDSWKILTASVVNRKGVDGVAHSGETVFLSPDEMTANGMMISGSNEEARQFLINRFLVLKTFGRNSTTHNT